MTYEVSVEESTQMKNEIRDFEMARAFCQCLKYLDLQNCCIANVTLSWKSAKIPRADKDDRLTP